MKYAVWKKAAVFLLAACMVLAFGGTAAFAEGETGNVAQVNGTQYATLDEVLAAAQNLAAQGQPVEIKLLQPIVLPDGKHIEVPAGMQVTLDFNGCILSKQDAGNDAPIENFGTMRIVDSKGGGGISGANRCINNYGEMVIESGRYTTTDTSGGTAVQNKAPDAVMTIENCDVEASVFAFANAGTATINGGKFKNSSCSACTPNWAYTVKSTGTLYFNGGQVDGVQGALAVSAGYAEIKGGTFTAHACKTHGPNNAFYALYVAGEEDEVKCVVYDGNFTSEGKYTAVLIGNDNTNGDGGINAKATSEIKGGTFVATIEGVPALKGALNTGNPTVTGGTFSSDVSAYVPAGSAAVEDENGNFIIAPAADACFAIGNVGYNTLAEAVAAVPADGTQVTITMLKEAQGDGVVVKAGQNIVFDFGGHTYNINGALVGSAGTETNGMQLLKGSVVTLKNGTLTSDKAQILVQNYCDLTLDGMMLDGTKSSVCGYVLSNNFGNTVATGDTCITAGEGKVAFDLWYNMSDVYKDGVTVTFDKNFTGKVTGKVEYGTGNPVAGWEDKAALTIQGGTFDTQFVASGSNDIKQANISISGGSFTSKDAAGYVVPGFELKQNADGTFGVAKKPETPAQPQPQPSVPSGGQKANPKTGVPA